MFKEVINLPNAVRLLEREPEWRPTSYLKSTSLHKSMLTVNDLGRPVVINTFSVIQSVVKGRH